MIRIGILGYAGRMGQAIAEDIAIRDGCELAAGLVRSAQAQSPNASGPLLTDDCDAVMEASDIVIDFTLATASPDFAKLAAKHKKPLVCGTTGMDEAGIAALKAMAKIIPLLYAPNTSLSLAVMKKITTLAASLLAKFDYDVAITDEHHRNKKDAPSGTAIALGSAVLAGNGGTKQPSYSAIRAGAIVGNHDVLFVGQGEIIRLHHSVTDRRIFAHGAVDAALWLNGKPSGFYGIDDVVGL
jgi:4-hydroxy-tetrahydrodipicolinate reductase